jgi:hypothetical protein
VLSSGLPVTSSGRSVTLSSLAKRPLSGRQRLHLRPIEIDRRGEF